jgi:uncharacterized protein (TIGR03382 family)
VSTPRAELHQPSLLLGVHVLHTEPRLGVPTLVWGNPSAEDPRTRSGLKRMGPEQAARAHLARLAPLYRLVPQMAAQVSATVEEPLAGQGTALVTFRQEVEGIEVFRHSLTVVLNEQHELLGVSGYLSPQVAPETRLGRLRFVLGAQEAISIAYEDANGERLDTASLEPVGKAQGPYTTFDTVSSSQLVAPVRTKRVLFALPDRLVPAWYVELHTRRGSGQDSDDSAYVVASNDGRLLFRQSLTTSDVFSYRVWADSSAPFLPQDGPQGLGGSPHPTGSPDGYQAPFVAPGLVTLQNAPFSQNDPWLPPGATETVGNNVDAYVDVSGADGLDGTDFRASSSGASTFDRVYDVSLQPGASSAQRMAAVTQVFYVTNFLHDWFYDAGFTERFGNGQSDNYGRGGLGNDSLRAEAQDFSGQNNANMMTPADGARPRLQMFLFTPNSRYDVTVTAPPAIAGVYTAATAAFGPQAFNVTADVVLADDGNGTRDDGCQALINNVSGKLVLIDRVGCTPAIKTKNAQNAGAAGVIIAHNAAGAPPALTGTDASILIPALSMSQSDGTLFKAQLSSGPVTATLLHQAVPSRDSTVDSTLVTHEWGHFISNRLISNGSGLSNNQGRSLGEGWGDFHSLLMMVRAEDAQLPGNDTFQGAYAVGGYLAGGATASGAGNDGFYFGLRRYPYSTDFGRDPLTFKHIQNGVALPAGPPRNPGPSGASNSEVHNSGEVWATMLWECYSALLRSQPRLTFAQAQDRMKRYLVMAYKLTPPLPTFMEARDALLMAANANDPVDYKLFSAAFARRGAGLRAVAPDRESSNHAGVVESFVAGKDVAFVGAEFVDGPGSCDSDGVVDSGETGLLRVTLANTGSDTLTATTASISSSSPNVVIDNAGQLTFPAITTLGTAVAEVPVALSGPLSVRSLQFTIKFRDAEQAIAGDQTASFDTRINTDEVPASSFMDDVESQQVVWTASRDTSLGNLGPWQRFSETSLMSYFHGPDAPAKTDLYLTSPPLEVPNGGSFRFTFLHRFDFDSDAVDLYDGGVIEISNDNGATWTDIGAFASPGYVGTISPSVSNPLSGREAYSDISPNYPAWNLETVDLGSAYQGQTVRVRFRIGTDNTTGYEGWDIDNVSFTHITNRPFSALYPESNVCSNTPPVARAGPDQTVSRGDRVTLDGTASFDVDAGTTLSYAWTQTAGPKVTLSGADTERPAFTAPTVAAGTVLSFLLTVSDGRALSTDAVDITVSIVNHPPVANAGLDQTVGERTLVMLDGRGSSDPDTGTTLSYAWTQTAGPAATLSGETTSQPSFTVPQVTVDSTLTFQLTVSDGVDSNSDSVTVTVHHLNRAPSVEAGGDQSVSGGATVTLTGSGTDPDGEGLSVEWTQASGPAVSLSEAHALSPTFTAPEVSQTTAVAFKLRVTDPQGLSAEDTVTVTVVAKQAPVPGGGGQSSGGGCGCSEGSANAASVMPLVLLGLALLSRRRWT